MEFVVEQVRPGLVLALRQRVLRPNQPTGEAVFAGDADGTHFAAFDQSSTIIGVASLLIEPVPGTSEPAWRLRGMASAPEVRGQGIGWALLEAALEHVALRGGGVCWCFARIGAVGFYERSGFVQFGEVFELSPIGLHVPMRRSLAATSAGPSHLDS